MGVRESIEFATVSCLSLQVRHCGNLAKDRSLGVRSFVRVWGELLTQRQCWPFIVEGSCFPRHLRTGIPSFSIFDDLVGKENKGTFYFKEKYNVPFLRSPRE